MVEAGQVEVTAQAEEYLEAVCRIMDRGEVATPTELARELEVAPPSALGMLKRLTEQGLVTYDRRAGTQLTTRGQAHAQALRRRHRLAELLLTELLGMPWERAHSIACRFEHVIDDEVEEYLMQALDHPATCPHGNPVDGSDSIPWPALSTVQSGQWCRLRRILNESTPALDYLNQLQLRPGARLRVCDAAPFNGPLTVEVDGTRSAISRDMAEYLLVEPEEYITGT